MGPSKSGTWTEEQDRLLAHWQAEYGNKWSEIAKHIPGKTGQQCAQRWRHRVNPNISREKWTSDEDKKLAALVKKWGNSWAEIARRLPGRTDQQCMGRWRRHVDPSLKRESWDEAEDALLAELVEEYGASWSEISKYMAGRSAHQCRLRWCQLSGAEQSSRSVKSSRSMSKSSSSSSQARHAQQAQQVATRLEYAEGGANSRRLSSTAGPLAGAAEGEHFTDAAAGLLASFSPPATHGRSLRAARRLSTVSEVGMTGGHSGSGSGGEEEQAEEEGESPPFTLRKTTARTAARAAAAYEEAQPSGPAVGLEAGSSHRAAGTAGAAAATVASFGEESAACDPPAAMEVCEDGPQVSQSRQPGQGAGQQPACAAPQAVQAAAATAAWSAGASAGDAPPANGIGQCQAEASIVGCPPGAAGAAGQPSVAPKRPRSRPQGLAIRPLELPLAPAAASGAVPPEEDSPALTVTAVPSLDLLSPSRTLSHAPAGPSYLFPSPFRALSSVAPGSGPAADRPPLFTPPSSGRKRALPPARMAVFGPRPPPLAIPDSGAACQEGRASPQDGETTPVRCTPGSREGDQGSQPWRLTPSVLTLLQSPQLGSGGSGDPLLSPQFGGLLTPEWAKRDRSQLPPTGGWTGRRSSGGRRASGALERPGPVTSLDFTLLGTSPKKAKTGGENAATAAAAPLPPPGAAAAAPGAPQPNMASSSGIRQGAGESGTASTATTTATAAHLLLTESVGRSALAAALQQGLGLASTAKTTGPHLAGTLTSMKGMGPANAGAQATEGIALTSDSVRVQLRTLLETL